MSYEARWEKICQDAEVNFRFDSEIHSLVQEADKTLEAKDKKLQAADNLITTFKQEGFVLHGRLSDKDELITELHKMLLNAFQITKNGWCVGNKNFDEYLELLKLEHGSNGLLLTNNKKVNNEN